MRWPFGKRPSTRTAGVYTAPVDAPRPPTPRRDWATLPPLRPATAKPIQLTAAPRSFADSLASRQQLVRNPAMAHVRRMDAPSGTLRGVLSPAAETHGSEPALPELQTSSPLPASAHRSAQAVAPGVAERAGVAAVEHLLSLPSIDDNTAEPGEHAAVAPLAPMKSGRPVVASPPDATAGRRSLADSRRRGLGPAYHGSLPEAMRAEHGRVVHAEPVPADLRATMHDVLGVDVGDRMVHRGPAVSAEAESLGATAFSRDGEVFVGDDVGGLDTSTGRAAVAHELTHVAQQRAHSMLPTESSAEGLVLEAQAQRVEQFVRGDAAAPKPPPAMLHARTAPPQPPGHTDDDVVVSSKQLMREMIDSGLASPDGDGGIVFTRPASSMTQTTGVQRQTAAAPQAPTRDSSAHSGNWAAGDTFLHNLGSGLANDMLTVGGSFVGFSDEFMGEQREELATADREFARDQTRAAYREMRLEHIRSTRLRELHEREDAAHRPRTDQLSQATLDQITDAVNREVAAREAVLTREKARALAEINAALARHGKPQRELVADASYDTAFHLMFDHPTADTQPTVDELHAALIAEMPEADRPQATPQQHPSGAGGPSAAAAAGGAAIAGAHSPGTQAPSLTTPPPAGHGQSTHAPAAHATPSTQHPPASGTGSHPAGQSEAELQRGEHWRRIGEGEQEQRMWSGEANQTAGQNIKSLGRHLLGDVLHQETEILGGLFGFSDEFQTEVDHSIDRDLGTAPSDRTEQRAGSATATSLNTGASAAGAGAAAHSTATHATSQADETARHTIDQLARDPYALDELALRLYPNIRSRLRQELLVDRERAGLLTDFR